MSVTFCPPPVYGHVRNYKVFLFVTPSLTVVYEWGGICIWPYTETFLWSWCFAVLVPLQHHQLRRHCYCCCCCCCCFQFLVEKSIIFFKPLKPLGNYNWSVNPKGKALIQSEKSKWIILNCYKSCISLFFHEVYWKFYSVPFPMD